MFARNVLASVDYVEKLKFRVHWRSIFKERASCIDHRASEVHRASTIEHPKLTVHRASTIDVQKNEHQASTIEHPKFTVHRASTLKWNHVRTSGALGLWMSVRTEECSTVLPCNVYIPGVLKRDGSYAVSCSMCLLIVAQLLSKIFGSRPSMQVLRGTSLA